MGLLKSFFIKLLSWICLSFLGVILLKRGFMIFNAHAAIQKEIADDQYYCNTTCSHPDAAVKLGKRTSHCAEACTWETRWAWSEAFYSVLDRTYLCGDEKCLHIFQEAASSWRTVLMTLLCMVILPVLGAYLLERIGHSVTNKWTTLASNARAQKDPKWTVEESGAVVLDLSSSSK